MSITYFQVNSFTRELSGGNPAGVCLLDSWLDDATMQRIAGCHELPETAFHIPGEKLLRWFTPTTEVDLCGHATLAAAHVLFAHRGYQEKEIVFDSRGGRLTVRRNGDAYEMDFPAKARNALISPAGLTAALGEAGNEVFGGDYLMVVLQDEKSVRELKPHMRELSLLHEHAVMVTAPGDEVDVVSRFFAPNMGIPEDHATGSAHCMIAPYWAGKLGRATLRCRQLSPRGGELDCEVRGERVVLRGSAVTFIEGSLAAPI